MTMDVSSLGIEVKSTGIKEASSALSGLGTSAANAETKVNRLTDAVERLLKQNVPVTMQAWAASMQAMSNAMNSVGSGAQGYAMALTNSTAASQQASTVTNTLNQQYNNQANVLVNLTNTVNNYAAATSSASSASEGFAARTGVMLNTLKAMTTAFLYYKSIALAKSIVKDADEFTNMNAKMVVATGSQQNATIAMRDMFDVSQKLRTSYESTAELFARMNLIMQRTGHGYEEVKTTVTGLAAALHLYGATTGESSSAMLAYAHSASTGVVHMRTLNSLMTSAPLLLQAFQDATGKSGEELRKMSTKGQLTFEMLNKALADATPKFLEQFERIPITFAGAMQRIENAWLFSIGKMGQDTGFNSAMAEALRTIEKMIPAIAQGLGNAFVSVMQWIDKNQVALEGIGRELKGLAIDIIDAGKGFATWNVGVGAANKELTATEASLIGLRYAFAAVQDVLTLIVALLALVNGAMAKMLAVPIKGLLDIFQVLADAVDTVAKKMGVIADALGMKGASASLKTVATEAQATSLWFEKMKMNADSVGDSLIETGVSRLKQLRDQSALAGVYNREEVAADKAELEALQAASDMAGRRNSHFDEDPVELARKKAAAAKAAAEAAGAKLAAAEQKEVNKQLEAIAALTTAYDKLKATTEELNAGSAGVKVGPAQTEYLRIQNEIIAAKGKEGLLNKAQIVSDLQKQEVQANVNANIEKYNELLQKNEAAGKKEIDHETALTAVLKTQLESLEKRNAAFRNPTGKEDLSNLKANDIQSKLTDAQNSLSTPMEGMTQTDIEHQQALIKGYEEQLELIKKIGIEQGIASQNSLTSEWDKLFDDKKATKFTNSMVAGMGQIGKAIAGAANAMRTLDENQTKVNTAMKIAAETKPGPLQDARQIEASNYALQMQMDSYATLAQAAQGFFKKGTEGYKVMGDVEKAFRLAEAAMAIENFTLKSGLITSETALAIAADAQKVGSAILSTVVLVAKSMEVAAANAIAAIAGQGTGDPYTAFPRMAAMAAALAALGIVGLAFGNNSGGSHGVTAAQQQAVQGTGTIMGDAAKQSQSIADSLKALQSNSNIDLKYSSMMVSSLQNIEAALTGVTNAIISSTSNMASLTGAGYSVTGMSKSQSSINFGVNNLLESKIIPGLGSALDKVWGGLASSLNSITGGLLNKVSGILGFGSKASLVDSGITSGNQSIGSVLNGGFKGSSYQTVDTTSKALWGLVSHSSTSTDKTALDPAISSAFTSVIKSMVSTVTAAAAGLGQNATTVAAQLDKVTVSLGNISLKGLTADQITTQLNAVFSSFGDKLVTAALGPLLTGFQQSGEGLLQTAVRVASGVDEANGELSKLGLTAIDFSQVVNKSGDVAAEIVRQTILLKQAGTGLGDIISTMSDTAANIGDTYISLLAARRSLQALGLAKDVSTDLLAAAGGLSALQDSLDTYQKDFFTSAQQSAMAAKELSQQFQDLGVSMPSSRAAFVAMINQLEASGASGQALAIKLLGLAGAFNDLASATDDAVSTATSNLTDAYNNQVDVINTAKTAFDGFAASLKAFKQTLMTGDLSTLSGLQKYQAEKALYEETQRKAAQGDQKALADFQQVATDFLTASRDVNASGAQYTADYQEVLQQTDALQQYSASQSSVQDQQLTALQQQVSGLITINSSVLTVAQAIQALQSVIATGITAGSVTSPTADPTAGKSTIMPVSPTANGTHLAGLGMVPFDGYLASLHKGERVLTAQESRAYQQNSGSSNAEMVAELKSLKATVASLRDGQREQTGALIAATYDSNAQNADAIVEGQKDAAKDASYNQRAKVSIA